MGFLNSSDSAFPILFPISFDDDSKINVTIREGCSSFIYPSMRATLNLNH